MKTKLYILAFLAIALVFLGCETNNPTIDVSNTTSTNSGDGVVIEAILKDGSRQYFKVIAPSEVALVSYYEYYKDNKLKAYAYSGDVIVPASITCNETYSVTKIGNIFKEDGASEMTSIHIPNSVTSLSTFLSYLPSDAIIEAINVADDNKTFSSLDGVLFDNGKTTLLRFPVAKQGAAYSIPDGITTIKEEAFYSCNNLTSIMMPNSITSIEDKAFSNCRNLTSAAMPNSVLSIGKSAFNQCRSLTSVVIPDKVKIIEENSFYGCSGLGSVSIPNSVTSIENYAFASCSNLPSVAIPNSVTHIGWRVFADCSNLSTMTIPNSVTDFGAFVFEGCSKLTTVTMSPNINELFGVFSGCSSLTSFEIPNSITYIGNQTFEDCSSLVSILIPEGITRIGEKAFRNCTSLATVSIPSSIETKENDTKGCIEKEAFSNCNHLKTIYIYAIVPPIAYDWYNQNEYDPFVGVDKSTCTLYVPAESLNLYKNDRTWKDFGTILPINGTNPNDPNEPTGNCQNIQASYLATGGSGLGDVKEQLVTGAKSWFYDAQYGARVSKSNTEAWLYTPEYDMSGMASVQVAFQHAINYAGDMATQQTMWVTDNFTGDVTTTNWQQLTIPNYPAGNNWTFVSNTVNVPIQYVGEKTVIAFKYTSGGSGNTATWEIKNLTINAVCANN